LTFGVVTPICEGDWDRAIPRPRPAPHLRKVCRKNGGDLEQIKFLLGHSSIQTTERYFGSEQDLAVAARVRARQLTPELTYVELQCIKLLRMDLGKDLVAASSTPLVLAILAEGESYGYAIIKRVAELSGGHLQWTDGMLYPVLHRLERQGYVAAKWDASESGRRRKYYRITEEGRAELAAQRQQWNAVDGTLRGIWMRECTI
jgi:PadR family transcriptional regulator PadR